MFSNDVHYWWLQQTTNLNKFIKPFSADFRNTKSLVLHWLNESTLFKIQHCFAHRRRGYGKPHCERGNSDEFALS